MEKKILTALTALITIILFFLVFMPTEIFAADVKVHIGIGVGIPPPHVIIPPPPPVALIPGTFVYYAPDVNIQLFFYSGYWYYLHDAYWFRAVHYSGPWIYVPYTYIPAVFLHLPSYYYRIPPGQWRNHHRQLKKHWNEWERIQYKEIKVWKNNSHRHWKNQHRGWKR